MSTWIDVHTHLNMLEIPADQALAQANAAGVGKVITIGTCPEDWPTVMDFAKKYSDRVFCTWGVHPHEAHLFDEKAETLLKTNLDYKRLVAVGEIGLDYYYDNAPRN